MSGLQNIQGLKGKMDDAANANSQAHSMDVIYGGIFNKLKEVVPNYSALCFSIVKAAHTETIDIILENYLLGESGLPRLDTNREAMIFTSGENGRLILSAGFVDYLKRNASFNDDDNSFSYTHTAPHYEKPVRQFGA